MDNIDNPVQQTSVSFDQFQDIEVQVQGIRERTTPEESDDELYSLLCYEKCIL